VLRNPSRLLALSAAAIAVIGSLMLAGPASAASPAPRPAVTPSPAAVPAPPTATPFGPGVYVFDPSMPQADIQATVDAIAAQQVDDEMGPGRYALLFKPGTYGTTANPLRFQVGYYTEVAGLGANPGDVVVNGSIDVYNRCLPPDVPGTTNCIALVNFWRSLSNLTINVAGGTGCQTATEFWAVSQAAPMRRVQVNGFSSLMDYCTAGPQFASGGFIADSIFNGFVVNGSQQQFLVRDSSLNGWSNGVWNQVFAGTLGAPANSFGTPGGQTYTTIDKTGTTVERPYLTVDSGGSYSVRVPQPRTGASGTSWSSGTPAETVLPLSDFFIASPATSVNDINVALAHRQDVLLTPGTYLLDLPIRVTHPDSVILGLGFPTLVPQQGNSALTVLSSGGNRIAGLIVDAGPQNSRTLMDIGLPGQAGGKGDDPTVLSDVFFRIGGASAGKATTSLVVDASHVVLDDIWAWRADHGAGVGWTANTADTGLVVNGDNVTAYGLFVEHYQKTEVVWNGRNGTVVFFQNENPYDPPSQAAWQQSATNLGYPAIQVTKTGNGFTGYGLGSYSFFNQGVDIHNSMAFQVPTTGVSLHSLITVYLTGSGGIDSVLNGVGAPVSATAGQTSLLVSYP
jgi:hypothetical protein